MGIIKHIAMYLVPKNARGFALLIAVIFVSVMLAFGTALASLAYKQEVLSSNAIRSQYAFFAADGALECALLETQTPGCSDPYLYENYTLGRLAPCATEPVVYATCSNFNTESTFAITELCQGACFTGGQRITRKRFEIAFSSRPQQSANAGTLCADVTVYEKDNKPPGETFIFAQGYDVPCNLVGTTPRMVTRGLYANF